MIQLVIFDYDGLMVNSEYVIYKAIKRLFTQYNRDLKWDYYCTHIGTPVSEALAHFYKDHTLPISYADFVQLRNEYVNDAISKDLALMPGVIRLLKYVEKHKKIITIATSGKREYIHNGLDTYNIRRYFQHIVCIDDVKRGKPYPDLIEKVLQLTHQNPTDAIILEDSPNGIEAAYRAGIQSIAIPTKRVSIDKFKKATYIVEKITDVKNIICCESSI